MADKMKKTNIYKIVTNDGQSWTASLNEDHVENLKQVAFIKSVTLLKK